MPGLYQRDNLAPQLAQAIENAQRRRESIRAIQAQRDRESVNAALNFAKALGRTYETWDSNDDEAKLAELQEEREEAIAQQEYEKEVQDKYNNQVAQRLAMDDYLNRQGTINGLIDKYTEESRQRGAMDNYNKAMLGKGMEGYTSIDYDNIYNRQMPNVPNYYEAMKRRGLY